MYRRSLIKGGCALGAVIALEGLKLPMAQAVNQSSDDPIIVIILDDLMAYSELRDFIGWNTGHPLLMPNMTRFSWDNIRYKSCQTPSSSCGSARPAMMFGIPAHVSGIMNNSHWRWWEYPAYSGARSWPGALKDAGWRTRCVGKVFHTAKTLTGHDPDCWSDWVPSFPEPDFPGNFTTIGSVEFGPSYGSESDYSDHNIAEQALAWISEIQPKDMLAIGIEKPHLPFNLHQDYYDRIDPSMIELPEYTVKFPDDPHWVGARKSLTRRIKDAGEWRNVVHGYLAACEFADHQVGKIIDAAPANARIIITSDHGYALGEVDRFAKFSLWENVTQVPMIIKDGLGTKDIRKNAVSLTDLGATVGDMAGVPFQGQSLLQNFDENSYAVTSYQAQNWAGGVVGVAVRQGAWQYIRYYDPVEGNIERLFNINRDKQSKRNQANYRSRRYRMRVLREIADANSPV